jgi:hypothetical protein
MRSADLPNMASSARFADSPMPDLPLTVKAACANLRHVAVIELSTAYAVMEQNMHDKEGAEYTQASAHVFNLLRMNVTEVPEFDVRTCIETLLQGVRNYPVRIKHITITDLYHHTVVPEEHLLLKELLKSLTVLYS